jgi:BRCA1-associated protein
MASASASASTASTFASASSPYNDNYATTHAGQHYRETLHAYALDTETQHVYDFCGQGWVHRLVQSKEDGKIVEVNNPNHNQYNDNSSNSNTDGVYYNNNNNNNTIPNGYYNGGGERSLTPGLSDVQEGEIVHRKLEGAAEQYNTLLKNQLEQQRTFYEERIREMKQNQNDNKKKKAAATATAVGQPQDLVSILKQNRKQLSNRLITIQKRSKKVIGNIQFLKDMNESLNSNKPQLKHNIQQAGRERNESNDMIQKYLPSLEEKLSLLMLQLTSSSTTTEEEE